MKRFSDKENNCKGLSALGGGMVNAHSKGYKMNAMQRPSSQQVESATEQQMMYEESKQPTDNQSSQFWPQPDTADQCDMGERTLQSSAHLAPCKMIDQGDQEMQPSDFFISYHPSLHLSRETTNDI